jgi:MoxR-like ATPase
MSTKTPALPHIRVMAAGIRANIPTLLWGDPGVAKTATITAFGEASGLHVETVVGSVREATDFMGLPFEDDGTVKYTALSWARRCAEADRALLFFDELTTAPPSVQRAMLRILQERVVGEFQLPETVSIVAAANPASVAVDGWDLPAPIANRLMHVDWKMDTDGWLTGVMTGFEGVTPQAIDEVLGAGDDVHRVQVRAKVTTFLRNRPDLLHKMPTDPVLAGKGWPSPRSWTNAMSVLGELDPTDDDAAMLALVGCVGEGAATEYLAWAATTDLYDPDAVLADPSIVDWKGSRPDKLFALVYSLAAVVQVRE